MKDKRLIYYGNPCLVSLADPAVKSEEDAAASAGACKYYRTERPCPAPGTGCVQLAGAKMARYVLRFYSEATEQALALEKEVFRQQAPLPPGQVDAYLDTPDHGYSRITDPDLVVERVWEYARAALDLKPAELILRSPEDLLEYPPAPTEDARKAAIPSARKLAA